MGASTHDKDYPQVQVGTAQLGKTQRANEKLIILVSLRGSKVVYD
jgi:hypothetical protein